MGALERDPPRERFSHRADDREVGRRAVRAVARADALLERDRGELRLDEVRQRHVLEEEVEKLLAREAEPERVLAFAVVRGAAARPAAAGWRPRDLVTGHIFLVSGQDHVALAPGAVVERSEEHTSELQSLRHLVCRLLL